MNQKKYTGALALLIILASVGTAAHVNAQTTPTVSLQQRLSTDFGGMFHGGASAGTTAHAGMMQPAAFGTVTAVNGNTITLTSQANAQNSAATTYTIDATNAKVSKNRASSSVSAIAVGDKVMVMGTTSGTNIVATSINDGVMMGMGGQGGIHANGVGGTVSAISGNTITLTAKQFQRPTAAATSNASSPTTVTYTVDATNATVQKSGATSSVSSIAVGDTLMVQGTVSGTNVTATKINDGVMPRNMGTGMQNLPTGNGQPIVGGTVSAVSGTSISITNTGGATYTIDATNAKVTKDGVSSATISNVSVGDSIIVQGTVNGSAVTGTTIMDHGSAPAAGTATNGQPAAQANHGGILGTIGGFFKHLFGF